ncbi:MAG: uracil-DNA glycosylase [Nitrospina sp.]|jgi:DNA polymerase|nr:uracil-DNA glycosylase [Nitrospina sp.]MBT3415019.1 uracil-DNA glycosylase [Nitrospina sp.]MBT3857165.1 uracil-DNA glycosylase [Nitrospina sp.]MBT4103845.1 uracil-DNA glycosylase [Nitrospina sp.]MBT4389196.1 uracil-DNA glycosylase [Nitrospina sp.]
MPVCYSELYMESSKREPLLRELKDYLIHLKDLGYTEIPCEANLFANAQQSTGFQQSQPPLSTNEMAKSLTAVQKELGDCTRCKLSQTRKNIVFGSGNPNADLVFVGEGPGADEDEQGLPFVGRSGKKLTEIIEKGMGLNREKDTYICNIVKCRPPGNRDPEPEEIAACKPFLVQQLKAIKPKVIVALGKPASSTLLGRTVPIVKERGTWHEYEGIKLMLTFHPSYLIRFYTLENRKAVHDDMKKVLKELKR